METYINPNVQNVIGQNRHHEIFEVLDESSLFSDEKYQSEQQINNDVSEKSATSELELGIALIEPVTAFLEFCQIQREYHPTLRNISFRMEPVSTMLSFEDLDLIEVLLRRWSLEQSKFNKEKEQLESAELSINYSNHTPLKTSSTLESEKLFSASEQDKSEEYDEVPVSLDLFSSQSNPSFLEYEITFNAPKLGLVLRKSGVGFIVDSVHESKYSNQISPGDKLISVNGSNVSRLPFKSLIQRLAELPRPIKVTFQSKYLKADTRQSHSELTFVSRVIDTESDACSSASQICSSEAMSNLSLNERSSLFSKNAFTLKFCTGQSNGLRLERGNCGDMTVITGLCRDDVLSSVSEATKKRGQFSFYDVPNQNECRNNESNNYIESDVMLVRNFDAENQNDQEGLEMEIVKCSKNNVRLPRPGAVVLAVNDCPVTVLGYTQTINIIQGLETSDELPDSSTHTNKDMGCKGDYYTMTFFEANASEWASVETVVISIASVKLTLIDDINGRDMPLLRGNLDNISINFKRGFNLKTQSIDVKPPLILTLPRTSNENYNYNANIRLPKSDLSELIIKLKLEARAALEYYNARIAFWEPLMEESGVKMKLEYQKGNSRFSRPGNLAFILSDGASFDSCIDNSSLICLNITDAAMDMLIRTFHEWSEWRKLHSPAADTYILNFDKDDETISHANCSAESEKISNVNTLQSAPLIGSKTFSFEDTNENSNATVSQDDTTLIHSSTTNNMKRRSTAKRAAAAALEFAQKRGAGKQKKGNVAKPFLLRNRSGVSIAFVQKSSVATDSNPKYDPQENEYENNDSLFSKYNTKGFDISSASEVLDGCECRFNIDLLSEENSSNTTNGEKDKNVSFSLTNAGARVRTYDGQYPHLCVAFDSNLGFIELLDDLPVVKNGQSIRTLRVLHKKQKQGKLSNGNEKTYSVLTVVWTVELENNRRILTLSSTISVTSIGCGISVDVGVRIDTGDVDQKDSEDIVKIGVAVPNDPFFLPLWLGLNGNVSVHVRPSSASWMESNLNNDLADNVSTHMYLSNDSKSMQSSASLAERYSYHWSTDTILECVLEYDAPKEDNERPSQHSSNIDVYDLFLGIEKYDNLKHRNLVMKWRQTCGNNAESNSGKVCCIPKSVENGLLPAWLSCIGNKETSITTISESYSEDQSNKHKVKSKDERKNKDTNAYVNVSVGSTLTLRNLLPEDIEWEVICSGCEPSNSDQSVLLDGSSVRKGRCSESDIHNEEKDAQCSLKSGSGIEVFSCDVSNMNVYARFKLIPSLGNWSEWAYLNLTDQYQPNKSLKSKPGKENDGKLWALYFYCTHKQINNAF